MKLPFDPRSLKFQIWLYFSIFAILLMAVLWFLQIYFLDNQYQAMKIKEINRVADTIAEHMGDRDILEKVARFSYENDMFIQIESQEGAILFTPESDYPRTSGSQLLLEILEIKKRLMMSSSGNQVSYIRTLPPGNQETLVYGRLIQIDQGTAGGRMNGTMQERMEERMNDRMMDGGMMSGSRPVLLYIFSPLTPVGSTVTILQSQLIRVTFLSILIAMILSILISRWISRPIVGITRSAVKLAQGDYRADFYGGHYSELVRLADTLNHASRELAKSEELQRDLIANVSHDLRTPLTMVKSYAEMIRDLSGEQPEKRNLHLAVIIEEADRLNQLVTDMLALSKMQSGVIPLEKKEFSLARLVEQTLSSYRILEEQEGYRFEMVSDQNSVSHSGQQDWSDPVWMVEADESRIHQVLTNLLNNAVQHSGKEKEIRVMLQQEIKKGPQGPVNWIRCSIIDRGAGIPEEELTLIWERYYRGSSNHTRSANGSGLGLSIVREILKLHGADYGVESTVGQGSTFWFSVEGVKPPSPWQPSAPLSGL